MYFYFIYIESFWTNNSKEGESPIVNKINSIYSNSIVNLNEKTGNHPWSFNIQQHSIEYKYCEGKMKKRPSKEWKDLK